MRVLVCEAKELWSWYGGQEGGKFF